MLTLIKSVNALILVGYFLNIVMFLSFNSIFMFWALLEMNMLAFLLLIRFTNEDLTTMFSSMLYYFMIQTLGSVIFLFSNLSVSSNGIEPSLLMMELALVLKTGMFPAHMWVFKLAPSLAKIPFFLILSAQKIPIIFFFSMNCLSVSFLIFGVNLLIGGVMLIKRTSMKSLLVKSSIFMSFWIFLFSLMSPLMFLVTMAVYMLMTWEMFKSSEESTGPTYVSSFKLLLSFMFLMSLPPTGLFFFKMYSIMFLTSIMPKTILITIWLASYVALAGYFSNTMSVSVIKECLEKKSSKVGMGSVTVVSMISTIMLSI